MLVIHFLLRSQSKSKFPRNELSLTVVLFSENASGSALVSIPPRLPEALTENLKGVSVNIPLSKRLLYVSWICLRSYDSYGDRWSLVALVYSRLVLRTPRDAPLLVVPSPNPLLAETCFMFGLVESVTVYGVLPFLVLIFTTPDVMSPYSTDGTPVMTSIDSTFVDAMLLTEAPETPAVVFVKEAKLPLFERRTPSTSTAVPKDTFPASPEPERMLNVWFVRRSGLRVAPPGSRLDTSATFSIWIWSRAALSIVLLVVALLLLSCAVTTTLSRVRLSSASSIQYTGMSLLTVISFVSVT